MRGVGAGDGAAGQHRTHGKHVTGAELEGFCASAAGTTSPEDAALAQQPQRAGRAALRAQHEFARRMVDLGRGGDGCATCSGAICAKGAWRATSAVSSRNRLGDGVPVDADAAIAKGCLCVDCFCVDCLCWLLAQYLRRQAP